MKLFKLITFFTLMVAVMFCCRATTLANAENQQGSIKVETFGAGRPMILIPGLGCSGEVWQDTVAHYKPGYQCHVVTLSGFAGQPARQTDDLLSAFKRDIIAYITASKLSKPIIVGHSLGGMLARFLVSSI